MEIKELNSKRAKKIKGGISYSDQLFLEKKILEKKPKNLLEIGVAAGISSATILNTLSKIDSNSTLFAVDLMDKCYFDKSLNVGFAVGQMIGQDLISDKYRKFTNVSVFDLHKHIEDDSIDFIFIDANHKHPWPAIDLLYSLRFLKEDSMICLHDINLPLINPKFPNYGVNWLFEIFSDFKQDSSDDKIPNTGSFPVNDKSFMAKRLVELIRIKDWEIKVPPQFSDILVKDYPELMAKLE